MAKAEGFVEVVNSVHSRFDQMNIICLCRSAGGRSSDNRTPGGGNKVDYANPAAALCAPTKPPYSQNPLNHEVIFTVAACQSITRSAIPSSK